MSLSQNIKALRIEKGLTQEQLANLLGVSAQAVSKWETSETYPDGALLVPIANALDTSLDSLFDNKMHSMQDITDRIRNLIGETPAEDRFHIVRDICWQIEKALFNRLLPSKGNYKYDPNEIKNKKECSYILNDYGFTHISNAESPFFAVFPEYEDSLTQAIGDGEKIRKVFKAMSSYDTMQALFFIHRNENDYLFEPEILADSCGIATENIDNVINDLLVLETITKARVEIDGKKHTLYYTKPRHILMALFLMANEVNYHDGYTFQAHHRKKPFLK